MSEGPLEPPSEGADEAKDDGARKNDEPLIPAEQQQLPDNPFSTETIAYAVGDELLGVRLRGGAITATQIPTGVMGPFVFRLHGLIQAIAVQIAGGTSGRRGPLAQVPGAGLLAVRQVAFGQSVTFHFTIGGPEQTEISAEGDVSSITASAVDTLRNLIIAGARGLEEDLYEETRRLSQRAGDNLDRLVEVFVQNEVDSLWRFPREAATVEFSSTRAVRTKMMLEYEELPRPQEQFIRGFLYRVDAREHAFLLDPADEHEEKLTGSYPEHLREDLRQAWDHEVLALVRTTHFFLRRQVDPARVGVELLDIVEILD